MGQDITECPHCGASIPPGDQVMLNSAFVVDAQVPCKSCGMTIEKGGSFIEEPGDFA